MPLRGGTGASALGSRPRTRASTVHGSTATAASPAHTTSPDRQLPPRASVMGTVTAAAAEVPSARAIEYRPVMEPTRSGNQLLTITGIRTLLTAMPMSASAVAARKPAVFPAYGRIARPAAMAAMPAQTTAPGPKRRASRGAMTPKTAKQSGGTEVSSPATLPLMPSPSRTSSRRAPRLVIAGRRLTAVRTMPTTTSRVIHARVAGVSLSLSVSVPAELRMGVDVIVRVSSLAMFPIIESWDDWLSNPLALVSGASGPARRTVMPLSHPRRSALSEQVIAELRNQITSGEWPVGSRIPTEPELVEQLGVARNTVREAVRALAHNGLLDIRQGSGTYVVATSELAGVMHRRFADADPRHIAELRSTLESSAAKLAAERRTERDLKQLDSLLVRREEAWESGDAEAFVTADATFHLAVVAASHNDVMSAMYADLGEVLRDWLREDVGEELTPETYMDHARLVDAIRTGDAETAATEAGGYPFLCRPGRLDPKDPDVTSGG